MSYRYDNLIEKTINSNIEHIRYEGTQIDKTTLKEDIKDFCKNISVGFLTWCNKNTLLDKTKGYLYKEKFYSKKELFDFFIEEKFG
jgi:hypothetical protein